MNKEYFDQYFVGLTDAEGCFITQKTFDSQSFVLRLNIRDISILEKIQIHLNCGKIKTSSNNMVDYIISNKYDLFNKLVPIFIKYPLLTRKFYQFEYWKTILEKRINKEKLDKNKLKNPYKLTENNEKTIEQIVSLPYFKIWLVGFIQGDGSFYNRKDGNRIIPEFNIAQKYDKIILEAIRLQLGIKSKILVRKCGTIYVLQTKSKKSIKTIYGFFHNSEIQLMSYHLERFNNWLN